MKSLLILVLASMNCFGNPIEAKLEKVETTERCREILEISDDDQQAFKLPELHPLTLLCRIGDNTAVLVTDIGSGLFVYNIYIIVQKGKTWQHVQHAGYNTANPRKGPVKAVLDNNIVTILSGEGKVVDSFDLSDVLPK